MAVDQVKDMGMDTVLIGHSERRGEFGLPTPAESNALMATKLAYILEHGLSCVFCIGEPLPIREQGIDAVLAECVSQLEDIVPICVEIKSSTRLQCAHMRQFRRKLFGCASRTRREQSIRPKVSRIDFDLIELENSEVWSGPPQTSG